MTQEQLKNLLKAHGAPDFLSQEIFSWIYQKGAEKFGQMSNLALPLRKSLNADFYILGLKLIKVLQSSDGTEKFLLSTQDDEFIEAVCIPFEDRVTACISSQAGCKFACRFCASGVSGFKRNLSWLEILDEILYLKNRSRAGKITHIVFMGTGEPLDNYDQVLKAIRIINSPLGFHIGARRITISTSGIIPGIEKLAEEDLQVELSVSLHAASDEIRSFLMPVNKKYPLKELMLACKHYIHRTNRQITFEYIMVKGVNSDLLNAQKLSTILKGLKLCKVNLIPANPLQELNIEPPGKLEVLMFKDVLVKAGIPVTLRKSRGADINAACGQLRLGYEKK